MKENIKQQGMILALIMILILPLTLMAISIMQSSREQLKMSSANGNRLNSLLAKQDEVHQFWQNTHLRLNLEQLILLYEDKDQSSDGYYAVKRNYISPCARTTMVSSENFIKNCQYVNVEFKLHPEEHTSTTIIAELPLFSSVIPGVANGQK